MGDLYDLDAAKAAQREALAEPFTFSFGGEKFSLPPSDEWPLKVSERLSEGNIKLAITELMSTVEPGMAERFLNAGPTMGHVKLIFEEAARRENMDLPASSSPRGSGSPPM